MGLAIWGVQNVQRVVLRVGVKGKMRSWGLRWKGKSWEELGSDDDGEIKRYLEMFLTLLKCFVTCLCTIILVLV